MLCDKCKKREATITFTQVVNGESKVYNLCQECAAETELGMFLEPEFLCQILTGVLELQGEKADEGVENSAYRHVVCPVCHTSYSDFVKNSRFGCADCYNTFGILMKNSIRDLQGSDHHVGKHPKYQKNAVSETETAQMQGSSLQQEEEVPLKQQLVLLQSRLQEAIREEEYEAAAEYRDEIRKLKEGME